MIAAYRYALSRYAFSRPTLLLSAAVGAAAAAAAPAVAQAPSERTVEQYLCKDVMRESGTNVRRDRLPARLSARQVGIVEFNIEAVHRQTEAFMDICLNNPNETALEAMQKVTAIIDARRETAAVRAAAKAAVRIRSDLHDDLDPDRVEWMKAIGVRGRSTTMFRRPSAFLAVFLTFPSVFVRFPGRGDRSAQAQSQVPPDSRLNTILDKKSDPHRLSHRCDAVLLQERHQNSRSAIRSISASRWSSRSRRSSG